MNEITSHVVPTKVAELLLEDLAQALDIPASRYEAAERSYKSVGRWLERPESVFRRVKTTIYPQGSFRLGTVIRPLNDAEDYDLDVVCDVNITKNQLSQEELKQLLGAEIKSYAKAHGMTAPDEARRCWTLNYADGAQFHMDVLPAVPDGERQRRLIEGLRLRNEWAELSVGITDTKHPNFHVRCDDWPVSNPKGYSEWFRSRMKSVFEARRRAIALAEAKVNIEEIPEYRVKTPLQFAIQILKRHRDIRFSENPDDRPISIIITTLGALAYEQETTLGGALYGMLERMDRHIAYRDGTAWIPNPTDPRENFTDKWATNPELKKAFFEWLEMARADFAAAASLSDIDQLADVLAPRMGRLLVESVANKHKLSGGLRSAISFAKKAVSAKVRRILDAPHRKPVIWPELARGSVRFNSATAERNGFRTRTFSNDADALTKNYSLIFEAVTDIPEPYKVYWQVVNTGEEARRAKDLRGGFDDGYVKAGRLIRRESTRYEGSHSIECFIVKDGYCVARSGPFIVNIA
jgi:hypothetical protein